MSHPIPNILILCTGNSARSIMAEALLNTLGQGRLCAYSAGSHPAGQVHPLALEQLRALSYPTASLRSKSWDEFARPDAPHMDIILTVCDNAAGEICPIWPGQPITAHWGFADPAAISGSEAEQRRAFARIFRQIQHRVQQLLALPLGELEADSLRRELARIGHSPLPE